jgi:hypothetical protein
LQTINNLGKKAREGTISIDEMAGGTFTISNGGVYGSMLSTPIINPPQVRPACNHGKGWGHGGLVEFQWVVKELLCMMLWWECLHAIHPHQQSSTGAGSKDVMAQGRGVGWCG